MKILKLENIEDLINQGSFVEARKELSGLVRSKVPRNRLSQLAHLCRRCGMADLGLKLLKPIVRSQNSQLEASPSEIVQYAQLLSSIGGSEEAVKLLSQPGITEKEDRALLFLSFAYFAQWNYQAAIPHLEEYLNRIQTGTYDYQIGRVNYVAALVAVQRQDEASEILGELIPVFDRAGKNILAGNCRELLAQVEFEKHNFSKAKVLLEEAVPLIGQKDPDSLFVDKWLALLKLYENPEERHSLKPIREKAQAIHHWETLRDLDHKVGMICGDLDLLTRVYYGSPFKTYRKNQFPTELYQPGQFFQRKMGSGNFKKTIELDFRTGILRETFKVDSLYSKLLVLLSEDFYRPVRIPSLFAKLYPDEYYDPEYSAQKLKMLISRLRKRLKPLGLDVQEYSGKGYSLAARTPTKLVYHLGDLEKPIDRDNRYEILEREFVAESFTSSQVASLLNSHQRTVLRWLNQWVEQGLVQKEGEKKSARYFIRHQKHIKSVA